jgi:hypothetical protein
MSVCYYRSESYTFATIFLQCLAQGITGSESSGRPPCLLLRMGCGQQAETPAATLIAAVAMCPICPKLAI